MIRFHTTLLVVLVLLLPLAAMAKSGTTPSLPDRVDRVVIDKDRGTAEIVSGRFARTAAVSTAKAAVDFIGSRPDLFGLKQASKELQLLRQESDDLGYTHVRLDQTYQGLRVWGCQKIVHFGNDGTIYMVAGQTIPTPSISITPTIARVSAESAALRAVKAEVGSDKVITEPELLVYPQSNQPRLAWLVTVRGATTAAIRWRVFVDAQSGEVLLKYNDIQDDGPVVGSGLDVKGNTRTLQTYQIGSDYELLDGSRAMCVPPATNYVGVIATYDNLNGGGSMVVDPNGDNNFNDNYQIQIAVSGHYYAAMTYEYFRTSQGRNSFDNAGSSIIVSVHDTRYVNNAYWDGSKINFCDGDGTTYLPFSGSLDVVAHELTHGVTQYTAGLNYYAMPGALNESMSDFFGAMVDSANWILGEEIRLTIPYFLRSMSNPHQGPNPTRFPFGYQPAKLSEYVGSGTLYDNDNGGVHINSGIPNRAGYLVGSTIGRTKAAQIWYRTLTMYLTPSSDFNFWSQMTIQSAIDLFGSSGPELTSVVNAMDSIGFSLMFVSPQTISPLPAVLGAVSDTTVKIRNLRSESVTIQSYTTAKGKVTVSGTFPTTLAQGDSVNYDIVFDATGGYTNCNYGYIDDTATLATSSASVPTITIPVRINLGWVRTDLRSTSFSNACLTTGIYNLPSLYDFIRDGEDALSKATLLVGYVNGSDTTVYMDLYVNPSYAPADTLIAATLPNGDKTETFRIASADGQIQGVATYQYQPTDVLGCGYVTLDYKLVHPCGSPLAIRVGVLADFDVIVSSTNLCNYDASGNKLVYVQDAENTRAGALASLSGTLQNLRAISNPDVIYDGLTAGEAYAELAAASNSAGTTGADWSALLSFAQKTLAVGDTARYRVGMLYSNVGSTGLGAILAQVHSSSCCIGKRGNVNGLGIVDLSDLSYLVCYLTGGGCVLPCVEAANVNGIGIIDLSDLSALVSYLTGGGYILPNCP